MEGGAREARGERRQNSNKERDQGQRERGGK